MGDADTEQDQQHGKQNTRDNVLGRPDCLVGRRGFLGHQKILSRRPRKPSKASQEHAPGHGNTLEPLPAESPDPSGMKRGSPSPASLRSATSPRCARRGGLDRASRLQDSAPRWCYAYRAMKRFTLAAAMLFVPLALCARLAQAQQCNIAGTVCITPGADASTFLTATGVTVDQLISQVDGLFQATNMNSFLRDFQNAQSFSSKGLGVDYASEATLAEVGATLSLASNIDKAYKPSGSYTDPPIQGGGANFSLMGGLGLGLFGLDPVMLFANWFKGSATLGQLDGSYQNWGLHGQLRLLGPSRKMSAVGMLVRWGGIAITSGADYSHLSLSAKKPITSTMSVVPGAPVTVTSTGDLTFSVDQTTWSVP